jgi:glycosyltransferase involved in cell wall biosynthesis
MGFTLLESQACGTPVVCTDAGAMSEFVGTGMEGSVVAQNSAPALAKALAAVLDLPAEASAVVRNRCREFVTAMNWRAVVSQHLALYAKR